jgi:hypothetical protein
VGVIVTLVDSEGRRIRSIPDSSGSIFDAAGDFDDLLDCDSSLPIWRTLDPFGEVLIDRSGALKLLEELPKILKMSNSRIATLGMERLQMLANMCAHSEALYLKSEGD